jgi:Zn-dependent protease
MMEFTKNELRDLVIAFIVLSVAFAISNVGLNVSGIISIFPIVMIGVGVGFLLHEVAKKYVAMKYGYSAEFKIWPIGLLIGLVTAFFGFVFAAPGAFIIDSRYISDEIFGKIAIAGPMANIVLAILFIVISCLVYPFSLHSQSFILIYLICTVGFSVNSFLATFNLLPFAGLDGTKVMKWSTKIWIIIFAIAGTMTVLSVKIGAENMVRMILGM